ncbi:MAG: VirB4 family type IV secretion system protein [Mycobacteriales bacterium]
MLTPARPPSVAGAAERASERDRLVTLLAAADAPLQVLATPARIEATALARVSPAEHVAELAALAHPRIIVLRPAGDTTRSFAPGWVDAVAGLLCPLEASALVPLDLAVIAREHPRYLELTDARLGRVLVLTGWPARVGMDWLAPVAELAGVAALVVQLRPVEVSTAARLLRRRRAQLASTAALDERAGAVADPGVLTALAEAGRLATELVSAGTRLLHAQVLLALVAQSPAELDRFTALARERLAALGATVREATLAHAPAWAACRPGAAGLAGLAGSWRLLDAPAVAATLPWPPGPTALDLTPARAGGAEGMAVLAGVDPATGTPLSIDRFGLHNPGRVVLGTSGAGKSFAAKVELLRWLTAGATATVIDPEGEFSALVGAQGGVVLAPGRDGTGLDPAHLAADPDLVPGEGLALLASWAGALLAASPSAVDLALLDHALAALRERRANGAEVRLAQLLDRLAELTTHPPFVGSDLPARLAVAGGASGAAVFAHTSALDEIDSAGGPSVVSVELTALPARLRPAVTSCVLAWAWGRARRRVAALNSTGAGDASQRPVGRGASPWAGAPVRPQLLVVDEAHLLLDDAGAVELLTGVARRARKHGVALEVVTQRLADFLAHPAGATVLATTATRVLLGCEDHDRAALVDALGLSPTEARWLVPGHPGRGLIATPAGRFALQVVASPTEAALAGTSPAFASGPPAGAGGASGLLAGSPGGEQ